MALQMGMVLYPGFTQLDLTGPLEVLQKVPGAQVHLVWKSLEPVVADSNLAVLPTATLADCPALDVLFVPGGRGQMAVMRDEEALSFLRAQGRSARYVTSVCTGALLLGAAGLLEGYEAATHWAFMELLPRYGARPVRRRVVVDRNRITGGGVTAGTDSGLLLAAWVAWGKGPKACHPRPGNSPEPPFRSVP